MEISVQKRIFIVFLVTLFVSSCAFHFGTENLTHKNIQNITKGLSTQTDIAKMFGKPEWQSPRGSFDTVKWFILTTLNQIKNQKCEELLSLETQSKYPVENAIFALENMGLPHNTYESWCYYIKTDTIFIFPLPCVENKRYIFYIFDDSGIVIDTIRAEKVYYYY